MTSFSPRALSARLKDAAGVVLAAVVFMAAGMMLLLSLALFTAFLACVAVADFLGRLTGARPPRR